MHKNKIDRTGEVNISNEGYETKIVEYNGAGDIIVEFQDEHKAKVHTSYFRFKNKQIKNPYHPRTYGVGYLGQGKYKACDNKKITRAYDTWRSMLRRCYTSYNIEKFPTYADCYVCDEWHNFQNFAKWYEENYYEIKNEKMELDKDILIKDNIIYSPDNCIFVPQRINSLFVKKDRARGKYPIGVDWRDDIKKYRARYNIINKENKRVEIYLGCFNTPEDAFFAYIKSKERYIKQVASEYKNLIPAKLYNSMMNYKVEIDD